MTHQELAVQILKLKTLLTREDPQIRSSLNWFLDNQLCEELIPVYQETVQKSVHLAEVLEEQLWQQALSKSDAKDKNIQCFALGFIGEVNFPKTIKVSQVTSVLGKENFTPLPEWYSPQTLLDTMPSRYRALLNGFQNKQGLFFKASEIQDSICLGKNAPTFISRCVLGVITEDNFDLLYLQNTFKKTPGFEKISLMVIGSPIDVAVTCESQMDLYRVNVWLESQVAIDTLHISQHQGELHLKTYRRDEPVDQTSINEVGLTPDMLHTYLAGHVKNIYLEI